MSAKVANDPTRIRRWSLRIFFALLALLALIWAAPILAARTSLVGWACRQAESRIDGVVRIGDLSLGWFSPVILYNVEVRDSDGQTLVQIPKLESDYSLLRLAFERRDYGTFRADKPTIEVTFTGKESNLERMLTKVLATDDAMPEGKSSSQTLPLIRVELNGARVTIVDTDTKGTWTSTGVNVHATIDEDSGRSLQVLADGSLHDGLEAGAFRVDATVKQIGSPEPSGTIRAKFSSFPLGIANVLVRRHRPDMKVAGSLQGQCDVAARFPAGKPIVDVTGELTGYRVTLAAAPLAEPLYLERINAPCVLRLDDQRLTAERAEIQSDLGKVQLRGSLDLTQEGLAILDRPGFELSVEVNLPAVVERLPKTLHAHKDLRLTTGSVHLDCKSEATEAGPVWRGKLQTTDVRGRKGQQIISWTEPMLAQFQVRNLSKGLPLIDQLKCSARFLQVDATRTADQFSLNAEADLEKLAGPLSQFIDLDGVTLAGKARADLHVQQIANDRFRARGDLQLTHVNVTGLTRAAWQESRVVLKAEASGKVQPEGKQGVDSAELSLDLGADQLALKWTEPIGDLKAGPWGTVLVRLEGDLARWRSRLHGLAPMIDDWQLAGQGKAQAEVRVSAREIAWTGATVQATNLRVQYPGVRIQEPTMNVSTTGQWNLSAGTLDLRKTKVTCPTLQVDSEQVSLDTKSLAARGVLNVTGDLARLRQWTAQPGAKPGTPVQGTLAGRVDLRSKDNLLAAEINVAFKNLMVGPPANPTWREPDVKIVGRGAYDAARDLLLVDRLQVDGSKLSADAKGKIGDLASELRLDLSGTLTYDLEKLEPQLRPILGKDVKIAGKDTRPFRIEGPLYPTSKSSIIAVSRAGTPSAAAPTLRFTELKGEVNANWKSLKAHGCDVGTADVKAILQQGWLQVYPIETSLNGGKLRLQPNLRIDPDPMELILLKGPMIERAKLTPAMCAGAIGYALPALANVTEADGLLSISLDGGRIPVEAPTTGELKGTLVLHSAKIGPSPLLRELTSVLKITPLTSTIKESKVPFHMVAGKVHHRDLEISFGDFSVKSSGAVGLDGTLALVIETPVPPRLASLARLTPAQAKQTVRIPIGGTLGQPRPDGRALESITSVIGRSILENELKNLFPMKK